MCDKAKDQDQDGNEAAIGQSEPWPRKKTLTPEEYYAFVHSPEMKAARGRAMRRMARVAPAEAFNQITYALAELTAATIDNYFTYDECAVAKYIAEQEPGVAAAATAEEFAESLRAAFREKGIDAKVEVLATGHAVPTDPR